MEDLTIDTSYFTERYHDVFSDKEEDEMLVAGFEFMLEELVRLRGSVGEACNELLIASLITVTFYTRPDFQLAFAKFLKEEATKLEARARRAQMGVVTSSYKPSKKTPTEACDDP